MIRLNEIDGQAELEMNAPGILPFTPLMKPPTGMDIEQWAQECVEATRSAPVDQRTQSDLLYAISLFGSLVHNPELFERLIPEEFMQESKFYQRQVTKIARENTIKHIMALLKMKIPVDAVNALAPALQNIDNLQRLEELLLDAAEVQSIEAFTQLLNE